MQTHILWSMKPFHSRISIWICAATPSYNEYMYTCRKIINAKFIQLTCIYRIGGCCGDDPAVSGHKSQTVLALFDCSFLRHQNNMFKQIYKRLMFEQTLHTFYQSKHVSVYEWFAEQQISNRIVTTHTEFVTTTISLPFVKFTRKLSKF